MKNILVLIFCCLLLITSPSASLADSHYVLPYPSAMPGSIWYKIDVIKEKFESVWYFGNFAQFKYHLQLSDKYLVEAKTLYEYKQYLLAYQALEKSNNHFTQVPLYLHNAKREGKNIIEKQQVLKDAALKHKETLLLVTTYTPNTFIWRPEKSSETRLRIHSQIREALLQREKFL